MTTLPGHWDLTMRTPVGRINAEMTFAVDGEKLVGTAAGKGETVSLQNIRTRVDDDGEHVTWSQAITKPMRLNLEFEVTLRDDEMRGHSRAGRLPRSTVTGRRVKD
jgi:hypothetical protein